jgi:hypothetical protein
MKEKVISILCEHPESERERRQMRTFFGLIFYPVVGLYQFTISDWERLTTFGKIVRLLSVIALLPVGLTLLPLSLAGAAMALTFFFGFRLADWVRAVTPARYEESAEAE